MESETKTPSTGRSKLSACDSNKPSRPTPGRLERTCDFSFCAGRRWYEITADRALARKLRVGEMAADGTIVDTVAQQEGFSLSGGFEAK
jgi:hypothetical protein